MRANKISVVDLTKVKAGDRLHHSKFAQSPQQAAGLSPDFSRLIRGNVPAPSPKQGNEK